MVAPTRDEGALPPDLDEPSDDVPRTVLVALGVFVILRFTVPSNLTLGPLGQLGSPATIWGLLCLLWYATALLWRGSGVHRGRQPLHWAVLLLISAWLLSYALLPLRFPDTFERNGADRDIIQMLSMVGIALLAADGLENRAQIRKLCRFMCWVWGYACVVALLQFIGINLVEWVTRLPGVNISGTLSSVEQRGAFNRAAGTTTHPIEFAVLTAMMLPMALQLQPWAPRRRRWDLLVLVMILAIPASISRSGFVGLAVGFVVIGVTWTKARRRRAALIGAGIAVVLFMTVPGFLGTTTRLFTGAGSDSSITTRTDDYAALEPYLLARPVLGRGVGTFMPPRYRILDNQYLMTLIEAGFVGMIALMVFLVISAATAREAWCHSPPGEFRDLCRALFAAIVVAALAMAFFDGFSFESFSSTLFLVAGIGGAAWRVTRSPSEVTATTAATT